MEPEHVAVDSVQELGEVTPPSHHWQLPEDAKQEPQPFAVSGGQRQLEAVTLVAGATQAEARHDSATGNPCWQAVQLYGIDKHEAQPLALLH